MSEENDTPHLQHSQQLLLQNDLSTPLGCLRLSGVIVKGRGVETTPKMRVYGRYALICITKGSGHYSDVNGVRLPASTGKTILVFPELGHLYAPYPGTFWDEIYVTFDGPVFDLWRQTGLLRIDRPIITWPTTDWPDRLRGLVEDVSQLANEQTRLSQLNRFLLLLGELLQSESVSKDSHRGLTNWVMQAQAALDINLSSEINYEEVAASVGMSYETFRKRFLQATGMTPVRYRLHRRIAAARELLRYSPQMTNRQAAEILGFADEFHFSRRFSQVTGITPRAFRQQPV